MDMAAFAINIRVLFDYPFLYFLKNFYVGYQETQFLELCCKVEELEPKADNCTKVSRSEKQKRTGDNSTTKKG